METLKLVTERNLAFYTTRLTSHTKHMPTCWRLQTTNEGKKIKYLNRKCPFVNSQGCFLRKKKLCFVYIYLLRFL